MLAAFVVPLGAHAAAGAVDEKAPARHGRPPVVRTYVVHPGDTLWSIAVRLSPRGADPRPVVDELAAANHLSGALVAGQTLRLP